MPNKSVCWAIFLSKPGQTNEVWWYIFKVYGHCEQTRWPLGNTIDEGDIPFKVCVAFKCFNPSKLDKYHKLIQECGQFE